MANGVIYVFEPANALESTQEHLWESAAAHRKGWGRSAAIFVLIPWPLQLLEHSSLEKD